jgi:uncharacterized protein with GYD domain
MARYLVQGSYTADGAKGLLREGGTKRVKAVEDAIKSLGGKLEAFYFAFGETDTFVIVDVPDSVSIAALSLAFSASGRGRIRTTALVTPAEIDEAVKRKIAYRAPGE